jgi:2-methylcitrate dehydratase PrpD
MGISQAIAAYIAQADLSNMSSGIIEKAKTCILDGIGCGLYGLEFQATKMILELASEWAGRPEASILGTGIKVPSAMAAKVNGVAVHAADYDDTSAQMRGHPTAVVLPPALALCEKTLKTGCDLLLAYIVGVEVGGKLGKAMGWSHYGAGWHGTGTLGAIAAASASAKALGLSETKTAAALGIAASAACGIRENFGTMTKSLHAGQASSAGVIAALLAEKGYDSSSSAFEGRSGFWHVYSGEHDINSWADELRQQSTLTSVMFKQYPSCSATHPALDALEELMAEHPFVWEEVEEITCSIAPVNLSVLMYPRPANGLEAKFSLPYCIGAFLVHGKLTLSHFEQRALEDPRVNQLMEKVKVVPDETLANLIKAMDLIAPTKVQVRLREKTMVKIVQEAKGGTSPLRRTAIVEKFRTCAGRLLPRGKVENALELLSTLESLRDLATLMEAMRP